MSCKMLKFSRPQNEVSATIKRGPDGLWRVKAEHRSGKKFIRCNRDLGGIMTSFNSWMQGVEG